VALGVNVAMQTVINAIIAALRSIFIVVSPQRRKQAEYRSVLEFFHFV